MQTLNITETRETVVLQITKNITEKSVCGDGQKPIAYNVYCQPAGSKSAHFRSGAPVGALFLTITASP
jgi:hypothetical protein